MTDRRPYAPDLTVALNPGCNSTNGRRHRLALVECDARMPIGDDVDSTDDAPRPTIDGAYSEWPSWPRSMFRARRRSTWSRHL